MFSKTDMQNFRIELKEGKLQYSPNVELVRRMRVKEGGRMPKEVRQELMQAVKDGIIKRLPPDKKNYKSEYFYHPNFEYMAKSAAAKERRRFIEGLDRYAKSGSGLS